MTRFRSAASLSLVASFLFAAGCGTGKYPYALDPKPTGPAPILTISPTSLTFSAVVGQQSATQNVVLGNIGTATLNLASIKLNDTTNYALVNGCGTMIPAGSNCTLTVSFTPQSIATLNSSIDLIDDTGNVVNATQTIPLNGTATGVPMPIASLTPATINFPDTPTGLTPNSTAAPSQTLTMANIGTAPLLFSGVTVTGTSYSLSTNTTTTSCAGLTSLAAGASCTYVIVFTPTATGAQTGSLTITDNSNNIAGSTQSSTFTGNGTAPAPHLTIQPTSLAFGNQTISTSSSTQTVTLANTGNAPLTLNSITLNDPVNYSQTNNCGATLAPGTGCVIGVTFNPQTTGSLPSSITLTDNSDGVANSTQTITLTGTGTSATGTPFITITPPSLAFGNTTVGQSSASQTVTLGNSGTATLTFTGIALNSHDDYILINNCAGTLAPAATCTLVVSFTPSNPGAIPSSITLTDNSGGIAGTMQTIGLTGTGVAPPVSNAVLSPLTYTFPDTASGTTSPTTLTVTLSNVNTGGVALNITGISYTGAAFGESTTCPTNGVLPANNTCAFTVSFSPDAPSATFTGSLTVTDDSGGVLGSTQTATFSGKSTAGTGTLVFTPSPFTFPDTFAGNTSAAVPFTLKNNGASVTGLTLSFTGGSSSAAFAQTNNCGTSLAGGASCTITATFTPTQMGTYQSLLTANYTGATQPVTDLVTGNGLASCTTGFTPTSLTFPATHITSPATAQTATFTNCSTSTITISDIALGQSSTSNPFTETHDCGATLASAASCTFTINFTPTAATTYTGQVTVTDTAPGLPQVLNLSGTGTNSTIAYNLYEFGFAHPNGVSPSTASLPIIYGLVNNAATSIDMVMYAMSDPTFTADLVAACNRGVHVRAILDQNSEKSRDTPTYTALNAFPATQCSAVWANKAFSVTHQKSLLIDGTTISLMSLNLESQYYDSTRDWAMVYNDPADYTAIENTFNADFAAGTPASGVAGVSDKTSYTPSAGSGDLIWSPQTAQASMLSIINNASTTLVVSNEELGSSVSGNVTVNGVSVPNIVQAMANACKRGVIASILIEDDEKTAAYLTNFATLKAAGCGIHSYDGAGSTDPYIHAKAVVADYGLPTQNAYMGSINYSSASMNQNRELGMFISDQTAVSQLYNSIMTDFNDPRAVVH